MKNHFIGLRLSDYEYGRLGALARRSGKNRCEILRELLEKGEVRERINKEHVTLIRQLVGESTNLNQLARKANTFGYAEVADDLCDQAKYINSIIREIKQNDG